MALSIDTPDVSWSEQYVTLGGSKYLFTYSFNSRDERWRLDISLGSQVVVSGLKIMENQFLVGSYALESFDHGDLICVRFEDDGLPVGRNNLGVNKPYTLQYYTNEEIALLGG